MSKIETNSFAPQLINTSKRNFSIQELLAKPTFFEWVKCNPAPGVEFKMYLGGGDDGVALRLHWNGHYEYLTLKIWSLLSDVDGFILDIGAHTGVYTLAALSSSGSQKTISFEPHFMNYARLNLNLRGNNYNPSNAYMIGIGERNETLPFSISTNISYLSSGGTIGKKNNSHITNINVAAIDNFFPSEVLNQIKLIKIDTEGYESACLRGMTSLLNSSEPIIFLESINEKSSIECTEILRSIGYVFFRIDDFSEEMHPVTSLSPSRDSSGNLHPHQLNRIALKKSSFDKLAKLKPIISNQIV
jgi:hypothetical protein